MKNIQSHFRYNKRQRNGIFFLFIIIIALQLVFFFADFSSEEITEVDTSKIEIFQKEMDSLLLVDANNNQVKVYPFNPNYITDFKGYQLGMSVEEIDRLLTFRATGKFVNSAADFQKVTKVSDSLLLVMRPFFKFPDWIAKKNQSVTIKHQGASEEKIVIKDINTATVEDFVKVKGIGIKLATRIVNYRTKLQGFSLGDQLYEVWYLDKPVADEVLKYFQVFTLPTIKKINVNTATFKEVLGIVYIDYELTKKIFDYRTEVAEIQSIEELKKIDGFPLEKFDRIALYLEAQ